MPLIIFKKKRIVEILEVAWSNVVCLMHFDGVGDQNIIEEKLKGVTRTGNPVLSSTTSAVGSKSLYLDGNSRVTVGASADFSLGSTFTIEFWMNPISLPTPSTYHTRMLMFGTNGESSGFALNLAGDGSLSLSRPQGGVNAITAPAGTVVVGQWQHIAITCDNNLAKIYKNGVLLNTLGGFNTQTAGSIPLHIGHDTSGYAFVDAKYHGYIDELRIVKGAVAYQSPFTPSTALHPHAAFSTADPQWSNVILLCKFNGENGSNTFVDEKGHTLTALNSVVHTNTASRFGAASLTTSASGWPRAIQSSITSEIDFRNEPWTAECWIRRTAATSDSLFGFSTVGAPSYDGKWMVYIRADNRITIGLHGISEATPAPAVITPSVNWYHIAVVKNGSSVSMYVNGNPVFSTAYSIPTITSPFCIYAQNTTTQIDSFRLTKAVRYTAAFTPRIEEFPTQ